MKKSFQWGQGPSDLAYLHTYKKKRLKLTGCFLLNWDTLWQDLWESCSYTYLVCRYLSRTISLDYVCIINELTMCPQLWSYLLMNNANSLQGVSWSYSIVTLMHQIENCCEISTQRCCTQLPCVLQFLDFFLLLSNLGRVSYDLGWVRHNRLEWPRLWRITDLSLVVNK